MEPKKILVVDDDRVFVKAMTYRLHAEGFEVTAALDGAEAVRTLRENPPDLLLLDILFPPDVGNGGGVSWDGFLILDWLHRMGLTKVPVIMLTAADPAAYAEQARMAGVRALFQKTVSVEIILHHIRRVLGQPEPQESLANTSLGG